MKLLRTFFEHSFAPYLFLLAVGFVFFGNVIQGPFILDDYSLIVNNESIKSFVNIGDWFTQNNLHGTDFTSNLYRPISTTMFATMYAFFGEEAWGYHVVNILIHVVNASLIFAILNKLFGGSKKEVSSGVVMSFLMALIFLVHPMNTEAVSYIAGLPDIFSPLFILLGIHTFLGKKSLQNAGLVVLFFVLAVLAKESSVVFAPLIAAVALCRWRTYSKGERGFVVKLIGGLIGLTIGYLALKFTVFNFTDLVGLSTKDNAYTNSIFVRLTTFIWNLFEYFRLMFFPLEMHLIKVYEFSTSLLNGRGLFGLLIVLIAIFGSIFSFKKHPIYTLGFSWLFIAFIPAMGIIPLNALYADRWFYLPSIGVLIVLGYLLTQVLETRKGLRASAVAVLIFLTVLLGFRTIHRNAQWTDLLVFYENELIYDSNSPRLNNEIGVAYFILGDFEQASLHYAHAVKVMPEFGYGHFNLANSYMNLDRVDEAIEHYYLAIQHTPNLKDAYTALSQVYTHITREPEKAAALEELINKMQSGISVPNQEFLMIRDM